jgi:peroxiredoxin
MEPTMTSAWIAAYAALALLVALLTVLVLGLIRRSALLIERVEARLAHADDTEIGGLATGEVVPGFSARTVDGEVVTNHDLDGSLSIVLFLSASCVACRKLNDDLVSGSAPQLGARLVVVTDDPHQARAFAEASHVEVLLRGDGAVARAFESFATPQAFVLDESRRVLASGTPNEWEQLRQLLLEGQEGGGRRSDVAAAIVAS